MEDLEENKNFDQKINQLVQYYRAPFRVAKEDALNIVLNKLDPESGKAIKITAGKSRFIWAISAVAASLLLIVSFYFYFAESEYKGIPGSVSAFRLPDQSRIVLPGGSTVTFGKYSWNRKVRLDGEAYFEVTRGNEFRVITKKGRIEVLGTRFRVADYNDNFTVECFEGRVEARLKKQEGHVLTAGTFFSEGRLKDTAEKQETKLYPDFALFERNYSGESLDSVANDIEKFFAVKIESAVNKPLKFSGSFKTGKLDNALSIVCESLDLKYNYTPGNQIIITIN